MTVRSLIKTRAAGLNGLAVLSSAIRKSLAVALIVAISGIAFPVGVSAQESVSDQLKRLRRDLEDIQAFVYRSNNVPQATGAAVSRDSDAMGLLQRQMLELQGQVRDLTGQIERVRYDVRVASDRLDKLVGDVDLRLQALERGGVAPLAQSDQQGTQDRPPSVQTRQDGGTTIISSRTVAENQLPAGTKLLGTVNPDQVQAVRPGQVPSEQAVTPVPSRTTQNARSAPAPVAAPGPGGVVAGTTQTGALPRDGGLPDGSVQEQYNYAFKLLQQRDYAAAEAALREFVNRHPSDPLAGNAMYWMGETFYVRKDFPEAARIFLDAYQRFPKGNKAADNLFKLARSLSEIGESASACTTYGELLKSFPNANARILSSVRGDMARLNCS